MGCGEGGSHTKNKGVVVVPCRGQKVLLYLLGVQPQKVHSESFAGPFRVVRRKNNKNIRRKNMK